MENPVTPVTPITPATPEPLPTPVSITSVESTPLTPEPVAPIVPSEPMPIIPSTMSAPVQAQPITPTLSPLNSTPNDYMPLTQKATSNKKTLFLVIALLLLIGAIAIAAFLLMSKNTPPATENINNIITPIVSTPTVSSSDLLSYSNTTYGYKLSYPKTNLVLDSSNTNCIKLSLDNGAALTLGVKDATCTRTGFGAGQLDSADFSITTTSGIIFKGTKTTFTSISPNDPLLPNEVYYYLTNTTDLAKPVNLEFGYKTVNDQTDYSVFETIIKSIESLNANVTGDTQTYEGNMFKISFDYSNTYGLSTVKTSKITRSDGQLFCLGETITFASSDWQVVVTKGVLDGECAGASGGTGVEAYTLTSKDNKTINIYIVEEPNDANKYRAEVAYTDTNDMYRSVKFNKGFDKSLLQETKDEIATMVSTLSYDTTSMKNEDAQSVIQN
ncbi:MAG: hypothetical protein ACMG57_02200 [Candidatus Dojkabacteria bacterium]